MFDLKVTDFTKYPGPRYIALGSNSGEEFREEHLIGALKSNSEVSVNLDGVLGYGSSFLEEIFGGIVRAMSAHPASVHPNGDQIVKHDFITLDMVNFIKENLVSNDDPSVIKEINGYITRQIKELEGN
ncbi:STAS-like domain-containing protein [Vibrio lamellibrachiae]|uniref:STAS-like domain-containing protein n=1 Tax=Vibrio lamellibrachiae TaxID=2910253 RepID=UPI003D0D5478